MKTALTTDRDAGLADKITKEANVRPHECYQCGKCTAGCPMAHAMDVMPRQIVRYMQLGMVDEALESQTVWLCAACGTCYERCPHSVDLTALIEALRHEAKRQKICTVREVDIFTDTFLGNVNVFGKSQEVILAGVYNTLSGNLLQNMNNVPHMLKQEMIKPEIHSVKDKDSVRRLMKAALLEDEKG